MAISNQFYTSYPVIQVRPWGLIAYDRVEWHTSRRKKTTTAATTTTTTTKKQHDLSESSYTGTLTPYAKKRLKRAINLMVASAKEKEAMNFKTGKLFKFKVNFVTLTLPSPQGNVTDKQLKKEVLDIFIKRLRRKLKLNNYVWRAEKQKNGNLHFHMITDTYLHYERIRNDWNECLNKLGFIDKFEEKHGHRNPNSTDVHAVWKVKNLTQYFIKYMSKDNPAKDIIDGKLWDCSQALKTKQNCEMLLENEQLEVWTKAYNDEKTEKKSESNYCLIFLKAEQFVKYVTGELKRRWDEYLATIRGEICASPSTV